MVSSTQHGCHVNGDHVRQIAPVHDLKGPVNALSSRYVGVCLQSEMHLQSCLNAAVFHTEQIHCCRALHRCMVVGMLYIRHVSCLCTFACSLANRCEETASIISKMSGVSITSIEQDSMQLQLCCTVPLTTGQAQPGWHVVWSAYLLPLF